MRGESAIWSAFLAAVQGSVLGHGQELGADVSGWQRNGLFNCLRQLDRREKTSWIYIVLTRLINHADLIVFSSAGVWDYLIDFP